MPGDHKTDPQLAQEELASRQKLALSQTELQKKVLSDTLISRFMAVLIENLGKRFIKNRYLKTLREKLFSRILRRRRGRGPTFVDTATAEALQKRQKTEDALPVSMLSSRSSSEPSPGNFSAPEKQQKMLVFSRFFRRSPSKNKPIDENPPTPRKRLRIPRPSPPK